MIRRYLPGLLLALLVLALNVSVGYAQGANPQEVTDRACGFATTWYDGISRFLFGVSLLLFLLAALLSLRSLHQDGPWGAIVGIAGVGLLVALIAALPAMAPLALAGAGATACP